MSLLKAVVSPNQLAQAYSAATDALTQAFGQIHETPDGKFCWAGRIGRAYDLLAKSPGNEVMQKMIRKMEATALAAMRNADDRLHEYMALCVRAGVTAKSFAVNCECASCAREVTFQRYDAEQEQERNTGVAMVGRTVDGATFDKAKAALPEGWTYRAIEVKQGWHIEQLSVK